MARRLLVIWFQRFASDLWLRRRPVAGPFALVVRAGNADRLHCVNLDALALGVARGMALADARAIVPDLTTAPADPAFEAQGLIRLRRFATRYAPQVGIDGVDGLVADITGVGHLFGGEDGLRGDLHARFERAGFALQSAIAPTRGGAWALSRHGGGIIAEGAILQTLGPLPVSSLRLPEDIIAGLTRMGLRDIHSLAAQPRAPLAKRFGPQLLQRLDQMLGHLPEPVGAMQEPQRFSASLVLPEPIGLTADVMAGLERLLDRICAKLVQHQMGARRLRFEIYRVDHMMIPLDIGLARPMRDTPSIAALFLRHVDTVDAGFGIDRLRVEAYVVEPMTPVQTGGGEGQSEASLADLISRLGNRLGFERITKLHPVASYHPERSMIRVPVIHGDPPPVTEYTGPPRPLTLLRPEPMFAVTGNPPTRFRWRQRNFTTLRAHGPERIAPDWWRDDPAWDRGVRDYWRIETSEGPRLWVFFTPQAPAWSVHGEFI